MSSSDEKPRCPMCKSSGDVSPFDLDGKQYFACGLCMIKWDGPKPPAPVQGENAPTVQGEKPHLVHEAYISLLRKAETWEEEDWNEANKFERHAINAALDIRILRAQLAQAQKAKDYLIKLEKEAGGPELLATASVRADTADAKLAQMAEALEEWESFIEFYAKREMEAPANSQEAVRDVRERLARFRKLLAQYREGQPK